MATSRNFAALALASAATAALAQELQDPTKPSAAWLALQPATAGSVQAPAEDGRPPPSAIVVGGPNRQFVMIDGGFAVHIGESFNGAKLVAIENDTAIWQKGKAREATGYGAGVVRTSAKAASAPAAPKKK